MLAPSRTLVEKLVIVHEAHHRPHGPGREQRIAKVARHYYDIWCLLGDPNVRAEIAEHGAGTLAREVCQHSKAIGLPAVTACRPSPNASSECCTRQRPVDAAQLLR